MPVHRSQPLLGIKHPLCLSKPCEGAIASLLTPQLFFFSFLAKWGNSLRKFKWSLQVSQLVSPASSSQTPTADPTASFQLQGSPETAGRCDALRGTDTALDPAGESRRPREADRALRSPHAVKMPDVCSPRERVSSVRLRENKVRTVLCCPLVEDVHRDTHTHRKSPANKGRVSVITELFQMCSLEKTLMLGKIEGRRTRGRQSMGCSDGVADSMHMNWSRLQDSTEGQGNLLGCSPWGRREPDMTEQLNNHHPDLSDRCVSKTQLVHEGDSMNICRTELNVLSTESLICTSSLLF